MTISDNGQLREFSPTKPKTVGEKPQYIRFMLAGEVLHALTSAPAGTLNDLLAGVELDGSGNRMYRAPSLVRFMEGVLRDREPLTPDEAVEKGHDLEAGEDGLVWIGADDVQRFRKAVYGKDHVVEIDELGDCCIWLAEQLGARPTGPSGRFTSGRPSTSTM